MISAPATQVIDRTLGPNYLDRLNRMEISLPKLGFAQGGRAGRSSSSSSSASGRGEKPLAILNFTDVDKMRKQILNHPEFRYKIVDTIEGKRVDLAL